MARGKSSKAKDYCKKEGDFKEFGNFPGNQGKRTDLDDAVEWCDKFTADNGYPPRREDIAKEFPTVAVKYGRKLAEVATARAPAIVLRSGDPRDWQVNLKERLDGEADDRKVIFFVDPRGNNGKSWFQGWYMSQNPATAQILGIGKRDDIAHLVRDTTKVFFFNIPRDCIQFLQYPVLEMLKDRVVVSPKFDSTTKLLRFNPHVIVFTNEYPDMSKMTYDRYEIVELSTDGGGAFAPGFRLPHDEE